MREILHQRWPWGVAAGLAIVVYLAQTVHFTRAPVDPRPQGTAADIRALAQRSDTNLLFVLIDTLRAGHLHSYGYERETSPHMDRIAANGVRFSRHLAQSSWTKCSMASLWTGRHPVRTGVTRFNHVIPDEAVMPAEILAEAGFRVAGLWRNGWVDPSFGFAQGFEVYERPAVTPPPATVIAKNPTVTLGGSDFDLVGGAREFLRVNGRDRWFLYLHMMDVHQFLYDEESAVFGTTNRDIYDNSVLRVDAVVESLFAVLREMGNAENTIVAIVADHGEAFGERGFEGHARAVYPESTDIPWLISLPFRLSPGITVTRRTENVDVWPTLLDLMGLPPLPDTDGRSRLPDLLAAAEGAPALDQPEELAAFSFLDQTWGRASRRPSPSLSVARGDYRYVWGVTSREVKAEELFLSDGLEDVSREEPEVLAAMRDVARAHMEQEPSWEAAEELELDELQLRQLRALGYSLP